MDIRTGGRVGWFAGTGDVWLQLRVSAEKPVNLHGSWAILDDHAGHQPAHGAADRHNAATIG
jgi:hypothetical protein